MKIAILPNTRPGLWAVIFALGSWVLFVLGSMMVWINAGSTMENIVQNPLIAGMQLLTSAAGVGALVLGLLAVIKKEERAILVFLAILSGAYSLIGLVGVFAGILIK